jgi:hypothetical protein
VTRQEDGCVWKLSALGYQFSSSNRTLVLVADKLKAASEGKKNQKSRKQK